MPYFARGHNAHYYFYCLCTVAALGGCRQGEGPRGAAQRQGKQRACPLPPRTCPDTSPSPHEMRTRHSQLCHQRMVRQLVIACVSVFQLTRELWANVAR